MRNTLLGALSATIGFALLAVGCGGSSSSGSGDAGNGDGGGCGDPPPLHCYGGCNGETTSAECIDGSWSCPPESDIACPVDGGNFGDDSSATDAASTGDGGIDCVTLTCDPATQYCNIRGGGAQPLDGGSNMSYTCPTLPTMPCEAGTGCACIPDKCSCSDDGGAITNECLFP